MDIKVLNKLIHEHFPDKTLVNICDYQNEEEQSYKSLFDELMVNYSSFEEQQKREQQEIINARKEIESLKKELDSTDQVQTYICDIVSSISTLLEKDIIISNIRSLDKNGVEIFAASDNKKNYSCDSLADNPGIYTFYRTSLFTEIEVEYNKINSAKRAAAEAEKTLKRRIFFWQGLKQKMKNQEMITLESLENEVVQERKERIAELLNNTEISNEEKYLKYMLMTPGMNKEYLKTLMGADEIGISANVLIELLEQPKESFCKETIEAYVSEVRKGNGYNLKRELAEELIRGEWAVVSDINGEPCKYQLLPLEKIEKTKTELQRLIDILKNNDYQVTIQAEKNKQDEENMMKLSEYEIAQKELAEEYLTDEVELSDYMIDL